MTLRMRTVGILGLGAILSLGSAIYFVATPDQQPADRALKASEPSVPIAGRTPKRSRAARILDSIRPDRLLSPKSSAEHSHDGSAPHVHDGQQPEAYAEPVPNPQESNPPRGRATIRQTAGSADYDAPLPGTVYTQLPLGEYNPQYPPTPIQPAGYDQAIPPYEGTTGLPMPDATWTAEETALYVAALDTRTQGLMSQSEEEAWAKSWGCVHCHTESHDPHFSEALTIGCTDCHGGNGNTTDELEGHIHPRFPDAWQTSANPVRAYTLLNHENPDFIRFVNPSDNRISQLSCGTVGCHPKETLEVKKNMMTHGCMLWGSALYNNGAVTNKWSRYGESYTMHGAPQRLQTVPPPTEFERDYKGVLPFLEPLPRFQTTQLSNILRTFERGGRFIFELGIPERGEEPGRPRQRSSNRGMGTQNRTDPVFVALAKTRLLDPTLNFPGTNDNPGDYRGSGCASCHVIYANDRSVVNSGPYAKYGNRGKAAANYDGFVTGIDPTINKEESGHPITHRFTSAIPSSQCMSCHMHPGTTVMNSYLGYLWSDQETDGEHHYPKIQQKPSSEEFHRNQMSNPNDINAKMLSADPDFLADIVQLNPQLKHTLADFHGHGWSYRAVFKKNREGILLNKKGEPLHDASPAQQMTAVWVPERVKDMYRDRNWASPSQEELDRVHAIQAELEKIQDMVPVHMLDIHLEKGMHCVDCHYSIDNHGDTKLYGEVRAAVEITCTDCHGTISEYAPLMTSGPAAPNNVWPGMITERQSKEAKESGRATVGRDITKLRTPFGKRRFEILPDGSIIQNSVVEPDLSWKVTQVKDTITPSHPDYNALSSLSKTVRFSKDGDQFGWKWGDVPDDPTECAHAIHEMNCISCHSSWNPSCFGCHVVQKADKKMPELHYEGDTTKNYTAYLFQTLRDDVFMLAKDGNVTGNRINPIRSACAIHATSYNGNRENLYYQQQTISAEGCSGIAFSTNVPHTVRGKGETKMCADCHLSSDGDNNAIMTQLLMLGTKYTNWMGRYAMVAAGEHGMWTPILTERDEPQAVIGSTLHADAYPQYYAEHVANDRKLKLAYEHPGPDVSDPLFHPGMKVDIQNLQYRGEYLYAACGEAGFRIYDMAFTDHKGFAERYPTAPVSPLGQKFYVRTAKYCTDVASPATIAPDPTRKHRPENFEPIIPMQYAFLYVTDLEEGLILVLAATLLDGNPNNNFIKKDVVFNPGGILDGARRISTFGKYAWISCDCGMVIVDISDHLNLQVVKVLPDGEFLHHPGGVEFQFRYAFVCDDDGVKILDVTDPENPVPASKIPMDDVHNVYVARTYAYIAAGHNGLVIADVKNPLEPKIDQVYNAHGEIDDLHDVRLGITYASEFAYLADGANGFRIVQLTSPNTPGNDGFSPRPTPELVASFKIPHGGHALALSEGMDRDRAVDEAGNHIAVMGRVGARPFSLEEMQRLYLLPGTGTTPGMTSPVPWQVANPKRDHSILNPRLREVRLHEAVEKLYGESELRRKLRQRQQR